MSPDKLRMMDAVASISMKEARPVSVLIDGTEFSIKVISEYRPDDALVTALLEDGGRLTFAADHLSGYIVR